MKWNIFNVQRHDIICTNINFISSHLIYKNEINLLSFHHHHHHQFHSVSFNHSIMAKIQLASLLLLILGTFSLALESSKHHFDYILLATQWPETFCEHNKCVHHKDRWLIHGAWPENNDGSYPQYCDRNSKFNHNAIKSIESEMVANWKSLKSGSSNDHFWSHEYTKHGTCAIECPLMQNEFSYFKSTLDSFKRLHIEQWLAAGGVVPSTTQIYPLQAFHDAIEKGFGYKVQIQCTRSNHHDYPIIAQINFCLSKQDLSPFNCHSKDVRCTSSNIGYLPTQK